MNKLYAVGIGPGAYEHMTIKAVQTLESCQVIIGYSVYTDLVKEYFPGKEYLTTPMRKETERCIMAFEEAAKGKTTAMVCSGDAGVYGMAGLLYEVGVQFPDVQLEIIPGVTAATGGAAVLGAPVMHDFAVISLSDLLTPWEKIEQRVMHAAESDLVICFYNPSSKRRKDHLSRACGMIKKYAGGDRVCGTVRNIGRAGEEMELYTLDELEEKEVDMFTTVFIGNSETKIINGKMVTPRGYIHV